MREFVIITFIVAALVAAVAGLVWLVGLPLQVSGKMALFLGMIGVFFLIPSTACFLLAVRGEKGMLRATRWAHAVRGLGMLTVAVAFLLPFAVAGVGLLEGGIVAGAGSALWLGSMVIQDWAETKETRSRPGYYDDKAPIDEEGHD
jgi:hypothetical protein